MVLSLTATAGVNVAEERQESHWEHVACSSDRAGQLQSQEQDTGLSPAARDLLSPYAILQT